MPPSVNAQQLLDRPHPIWVGKDSFSALSDTFNLQQYSKVCLISDAALPEPVVTGVRASLGSSAVHLPIAVSEGSKTIEQVMQLWEAFLRSGIDRASAVVILGGGVLGDLAGFAAGTFMRGCHVFYLPTTLLAQVDASIGGKTGVNFGSVKNLVGVVAQPRGVLIDTSVLRSLPPRHLAAGAAEMIKHGVIADRAYFERLSTPAACDTSEFLERVAHSVRIKAEIVASDPSEHGRRKLLNFGHSIGHALEAVALSRGADMIHGEAVSLGMVAESFISFGRGWIVRAELEAVESLLAGYSLPIRLEDGLPRDAVLRALQHDKKNVSGEIRMTLIRAIGAAEHDVPAASAEVRSALDYVFRPKSM